MNYITYNYITKLIMLYIITNSSYVFSLNNNDFSYFFLKLIFFKIYILIKIDLICNNLLTLIS